MSRQSRRPEQDWLPALPPHWGYKKLKFLFRQTSGGTPAKEIAAYWIGDIPWVSPKDMKCSVISDTEDHISAQAIRESATTLVPRDTLLLVVRSGILRHSIPVALAGCSVTINQDIKALIPRRADTKPQYYAALIHGLQDQLLTLWRKQGATVESLESDLIGDTVVPVPPPAEQRAIADFLDRETAKIDALIAAQERLIALLDEKRQATITHAVTKGLDPNAPMKESGVEWMGKVPQHWTVKSLKYLASIASGYPPPASFDRERGRYPVYGSNGMIGYCEEYFVRRESLVVGRVGASGAVNVTPARSWVSDNALLLRVVGREASLEWLRYILETLNLGTQASKTAQPLVTGTFLGGQLIPTPNPREQHAIADFVDRNVASIDSLRHKTERFIERLRERRTALITAAVTGQIDVSRPTITEAAE